MYNNLKNSMTEDASNISKPSILSEKSLVDKIYIIRGEKVMLDFELAEIYGYKTKAFNQQVKNNIDKFDEDFRFRLTKSEYDNLRSKNLTSSFKWGGKHPYHIEERREKSVYTPINLINNFL